MTRPAVTVPTVTETVLSVSADGVLRVGVCSDCGSLVFAHRTMRDMHCQAHLERDERISQLEATVAALAAGLIDPGNTHPPKGKP